MSGGVFPDFQLPASPPQSQLLGYHLGRTRFSISASFSTIGASPFFFGRVDPHLRFLREIPASLNFSMLGFRSAAAVLAFLRVAAYFVLFPDVPTKYSRIFWPRRSPSPPCPLPRLQSPPHAGPLARHARPNHPLTCFRQHRLRRSRPERRPAHPQISFPPSTVVSGVFCIGALARIPSARSCGSCSAAGACRDSQPTQSPTAGRELRTSAPFRSRSSSDGAAARGYSSTAARWRRPSRPRRQAAAASA